MTEAQLFYFIPLFTKPTTYDEIYPLTTVSFDLFSCFLQPFLCILLSRTPS